MYNKQDIEQLKHSIEFEDLLLALGFENVNIIKNRASCLLHDGNNKTSFSWSDETFYCFGCYAKGDKLDLIQQIKHCNFKDAINYLSGLTGYVLIETTPKIKTKKVDYSKMEFPVKLVETMARRTIRGYYNTDEIEQEIKVYTDILILLKYDNVPALFSRIEDILDNLDSELAFVSYQRNQI